ncbi:hypothetical protein [Paraburkholderia humisilvae]|nr:hypothetical protein [Paraburkholderia humisilvae]
MATVEFSACGARLERPACGTIHESDVTAATNLKNTAASSAVSACGGEG